MAAPKRMPIYRLIHIDNLPIYLHRSGMHAPNNWPDDGLEWKPNHDAEVQGKRTLKAVPCGPGGTVLDYVSFYFGPLSPMMLRLKTGRVVGYTDGQEPLIYLVSTAQAVKKGGVGFVFTDGHDIVAWTEWYADLRDLKKVDGDMVGQRYWTDTADDPHRQWRKQAEFLVHRFCPWELVHEIGVIDEDRKKQVEGLLAEHDPAHKPVVEVRRDWYYW
jgi:hypothetical protein